MRVNKGSDDKPEVRARLVARDFKVKGSGTCIDLFAAMPPLEAKKMLFRQAVREGRSWEEGKWCGKKLIFIDVKKAHLNGKVPDDIHAFVRMPCGRIWKLKRWIYGSRPAANAWEKDFVEKLTGAGFEQGKSCPTVLFRRSTGCRLVVHGDDFTFASWENEVPKLLEEMKGWYEIKVRAILGGSPEDDEEVTILGRRLRWRRGTREIEYEADDKYVKQVMSEMNLQADSKGLDAPIEMEIVEDGGLENDSDLLDIDEARRYRAVAATLNYLALDRSDINDATKEICRSVSKPRKSGWANVKHLARYLVAHPRLLWRFAGDVDQSHYLDVFSDSDWAGDRRSRKSTSGGVASIDGAAIKHWSSTQGSIALSVGEAEYYALVKAAAEGLGIQALARDLGIELTLRIWVDSTTADAIASRIGLGKVRHMEVKYLWAQEAHQNKRFCIRKIAGERNPADVLTKPKSVSDMQDKIQTVGGYVIPRNIWGTRSTPRRERWADVCDSD